MIENCSASKGGGVYGTASSAQLTECTLSNNVASSHGGGCYFTGEGPILRNCTITGNQSASSGGGARCVGDADFFGCMITGNTASGYGGGIYNVGGSTRGNISGCTVVGNVAGWGGGLNLNGGATLVSGCLIADNAATNDGGGVYCIDDNELTIRNCVIAENSASGNGGGLYCVSHVPAEVRHCTIACNTAVSGGGVFSQWQWSTLSVLIDSIVWGNTPTSIDDHSQVPPRVTYTCVEFGWPGEGNSDADPLFVDAGAGDYHLRPLSPCIDAGDPASEYGNEPMPNGGRVNMGAYGNTAEATCTPGDVDGDGDIDMDDLMAVHAALGTDDPAYDLDGDGMVTFADLRIVYEHIPEGERDLGGVPTLWALGYMAPTDPSAQGLDPTQDQSGLDNDGDARTNYEEYVAGTDPTDPASFLAVTAIECAAALDGDVVTVSWTVVPGKHYCLYCSQALGPDAEWVPAQGTYDITDGTATQAVPVDCGVKMLFFRVEVW
jgi:parallel beta-helix repeat protein